MGPGLNGCSDGDEGGGINFPQIQCFAVDYGDVGDHGSYLVNDVEVFLEILQEDDTTQKIREVINGEENIVHIVKICSQSSQGIANLSIEARYILGAQSYSVLYEGHPFCGSGGNDGGADDLTSCEQPNHMGLDYGEETYEFLEEEIQVLHKGGEAQYHGEVVGVVETLRLIAVPTTNRLANLVREIMYIPTSVSDEDPNDEVPPVYTYDELIIEIQRLSAF